MWLALIGKPWNYKINEYTTAWRAVMPQDFDHTHHGDFELMSRTKGFWPNGVPVAEVSFAQSFSCQAPLDYLLRGEENGEKFGLEMQSTKYHIAPLKVR